MDTITDLLNEREQFRHRYLIPSTPASSPSVPILELASADKLPAEVENLRSRLRNLVRHTNHNLHPAAPLGISGYQSLQRLLKLADYEVVREGVLDEKVNQKVGTIHTRTRPDRTLDVLLEAQLKGGGYAGWELTSGYTYYHMESLSEFTHFLEDYEGLSDKARNSGRNLSRYVLLGGLGGAIASPLGTLLFTPNATVGGYVFCAGMCLISGAIGGIGFGLHAADKGKDYYAIFHDNYEPKALYGKTHALSAALELPPPEMERGEPA